MTSKRIIETPEGYIVNGAFTSDLGVAREMLEDWEADDTAQTVTLVTTLQLQEGARVIVSRGIVRTVDYINQSDYRNARNQPLYAVIWAEGDTDEWSRGNMVSADYGWRVLS